MTIPRKIGELLLPFGRGVRFTITSGDAVFLEVSPKDLVQVQVEFS